MSHPDSETPPGMPRWVKVVVLVVILLLLLVVTIMLLVGGDHGPGRHAPGMLTGVAMLTFRPNFGRPTLGDDTATGDGTPTEDNH